MHEKTVFMSDMHLAAKKSKARHIHEFLDSYDPKSLNSIYLVGDVVDIWKFKQVMNMPKRSQKYHLRCIDKLIRMSNKGVEVRYIWGNHDEFLARFAGSKSFGNISLSERESYTCSEGKKYLVLHGHQFDLMSRYMLVGKLGDNCYDLAIWFNEKLNRIRMMLGMKYWSVSKYLKTKVKRASQFIDRFENISTDYAKENGYDGVICGHIHDPKDCMVNGIRYINLGCWTDISNLTYAVDEGRGIELKKWD